MNAQVTTLVPLSQRPLRERVAANVRAEMARYGVSQADVAAALGVSQQAVSMKIHGRRPLSLDDLEVVAPLFGLEAADLLASNDRPNGPASGAGVGLDRPTSD